MNGAYRFLKTVAWPAVAVVVLATLWSSLSRKESDHDDANQFRGSWKYLPNDLPWGTNQPILIVWYMCVGCDNGRWWGTQIAQDGAVRIYHKGDKRHRIPYLEGRLSWEVWTSLVSRVDSLVDNVEPHSAEIAPGGNESRFLRLHSSSGQGWVVSMDRVTDEKVFTFLEYLEQLLSEHMASQGRIELSKRGDDDR